MMDGVREQMDLILGTFDTLLRLGYPEDDIGVQVGSDSVFVFLLRFGSRFLVRIGDRHPKIDYEICWRQARDQWNASSQEERKKLICDYELRGLHVELLAGLSTNGLYPIRNSHERASTTGRRK